MPNIRSWRRAIGTRTATNALGRCDKWSSERRMVSANDKLRHADRIPVDPADDRERAVHVSQRTRLIAIGFVEPSKATKDADVSDHHPCASDPTARKVDNLACESPARACGISSTTARSRDSCTP